MTNVNDFIGKYRNIITIALSLIGIVLMAYYDYCDTECSYLRGDLLGIDLKWVGIAYMAIIIIFAAFKQTPFVRALLAAGLGVEVHLYAFQIQNNVYCPFCLAFSVMVILSFIINYEVPSAWREKRGRMWLYFLGEVDFPMFKIHKLPLLIFSLLGYLTVFLTFNGSVTPAYGQTPSGAIPSLGKGPYEIIIFTDYFCPPCYRIDTKAEPLLKELLATQRVKLTFVDVPFNRSTPVYAKYYLYAVQAHSDATSVFRVRKILFDAAQSKKIQKEADLVAYLKNQKVAWKTMDEKSVFPSLTAVIQKNDIRATPSCVIKYSNKDSQKLIGDVEIWKGLTELKARLSAGNK